MWRGSALAALFVLVTLTATAVRIVEGERANETFPSAGLFWSTAKEEPNLLRKTEPHDDDSAAASSSFSADAIVNDHDDSNGGFSSLDGMLQWAIGHSDPAKLKETAKDVQRLSTAELKKRQLGIKI
uniref:Uncharacterized protein MANES_08G098100 n=1 Tax=Rhizophora mucronata TaxID=61149 RepID=A0A2P2LMR9_RHIMU